MGYRLDRRKPHAKTFPVTAQAKPGTPALMRMARTADASSVLHRLSSLQLKAKGTVQRKGGNKKGTFIGDASACHLHIDIANPHFKLGNDLGSRMNFGRDYKLSRMQSAYDEIKSEYAGKPGYDACIKWLEQQGCK